MKPRKASAEFRTAVGNNLTTHRRVRGLTQDQLGERSGLTKHYISKVEHGNINVSLATLEALANGLGCDVTQLVRRTNNRKG